MDEGQWNEAREGALTRLAEVLDEAHAVAAAMEDPSEVRIEQRVTVETSGYGHAKWNLTNKADIFVLSDEEAAALEAEVG